MKSSINYLDGQKIILDLCGGTGSWSKPYKDAGYDVRLITLPEHNVLTYTPPEEVYGILAAPPCTEFAGSGARWWTTKDPILLEEAIKIVRACLNIINLTNPKFWALENPVGRLKKCVPELGEPVFRFNPCDFGDPWTKRTCLWGRFHIPRFNRVEPTEGSKIHRIPPGPNRQALRSITPPGFAKAFFEANR